MGSPTVLSLCAPSVESSAQVHTTWPGALSHLDIVLPRLVTLEALLLVERRVATLVPAPVWECIRTLELTPCSVSACSVSEMADQLALNKER